MASDRRVRSDQSLSEVEESRGNSDEDRLLCTLLNQYEGAWVVRACIEPFNARNVAELRRYKSPLMNISEEKQLLGVFLEDIDRSRKIIAQMADTTNKAIGKGNLVLAKYDALPPWPAIIKRANDSKEPRRRWKWHSGNILHCHFLGDNTLA